MKLFTNPRLDVHTHISKDCYSGHSKEFTFVEIVEGEGVRVEESEKILGEGWLYMVEELQLANKNKEW